MLHSLLLWNDAYFFGGIAQFFLIAALIIAGVALIHSWFSSTKDEFLEPKLAPGQPAKASKESGCADTFAFVGHHEPPTHYLTLYYPGVSVCKAASAVRIKVGP
jgi:hypothetical protein